MSASDCEATEGLFLSWVSELQDYTSGSDLIIQAIGASSAQQRVSADVAFAVLSEQARTSGLTLEDIAVDILAHRRILSVPCERSARQ